MEQLKFRHLVLNSWHHFSVVLHKSPHGTTSVKELSYCLEKIFFGVCLLYRLYRFFDIFPWHNFFQAYSTLNRSNTVFPDVLVPENKPSGSTSHVIPTFLVATIDSSSSASSMFNCSMVPVIILYRFGL